MLVLYLYATQHDTNQEYQGSDEAVEGEDSEG